MVGERDLIALLHRADWTRLCLSGAVRGADEPRFSVFSWSDSRRPGEAEGTDPPDTASSPEPEGDEGSPAPGDEGSPVADAERAWTLLLAPGKRYREELPAGREIRGCDGERIWLWDADEPARPRVRLIGGPQPPFATLLAPSWLLDHYELTVEGDTVACGRAAIRVAATRRAPRDSHVQLGRSFGLVPLGPRHASTAFRYDHVSAVVDAELGILLSCETRKGDDAPELTEFVSLTIDPDTDAAAFIAPPGSVTSAPFDDRPPFSWDAAKTAVGVAAGGLGAVIKYSPFGRERVDPFERATSEDDPEPEMPLDDPLPGEATAAAAPVSDEVLELLYRAGGVVPELTCTLHQWVDLSALLAAVPEAARKTGFGGVGYLVDAMVEAGRSAGTSVTHEVRTVRMGGWDKYRIDRLGRPRSRTRKRRDLLTVACDGEQRWQVYPDRVYHGPAGPPQDELLDLLDGSWLLACDLSGGEEIAVGGRRGYRFFADARPALREPFAVLAKLTFPAVAVVDAETGLVLRVTTYKGGKPVVRHELRDVQPGGGGGDFGFDVPPGMTVVEETEEEPTRELDEGVLTPVDAAKAAARGLFDSFRAGRPPR